MPGGTFDESMTVMQNSDPGRVDLLEQALVEYIERYGMTDAAARAMRVARPDLGKAGGAVFLRHKSEKQDSTLRARAKESTQS